MRIGVRGGKPTLRTASSTTVRLFSAVNVILTSEAPIGRIFWRAKFCVKAESDDSMGCIQFRLRQATGERCVNVGVIHDDR